MNYTLDVSPHTQNNLKKSLENTEFVQIANRVQTVRFLKIGICLDLFHELIFE